MKTKLEIESKPQPLHQRRNPVDIEQIEHQLHLQQNIIKGETETLNPFRSTVAAAHTA